jgi:hypothetical protein
MSEARAVSEIEGVLEDFLADINDKIGSRKLESVLYEGETVTRSDLGFKPETYTENNLIEGLLEAVGLGYEEQPYADGETADYPDFLLTDLDIEPDVIGENKPINRSEEAVSDIKEYLNKKSVGAEYGIATDGFDWYVYKIEVGGDSTDFPEVRHVDLKPVIRSLAHDRGHVGQTQADEVDVSEILDDFVGVFSKDSFEGLLSQRAPREIRDARKRDVEEFYDLYIELLFGEGDNYHYETNLLNDIVSPDGADEEDERLFVVTLMNRLLFVKFLEQREVLDEGFLRDMVDGYEDSESWATLYRSRVQPLFYNLLNTPVEDRDDEYRGDLFDTVPYLNGGLFTENVPREREYDVRDRVLPTVISDLIEGSRLELDNGGLDPAILGSVFEKTINHMGGGETQKDIGAYYTPNDVTELVSEQTVDPKIEETLVDVFVDEFADEETEEDVRGFLEDELGLSKILRNVENGVDQAIPTEDAGMVNVEFSDDDAVRRAKEEIEGLKMLDPACGSGHFLTTVMDEVHRVQLALLRGMNGEVTDADRYEAKRKLALDSTYGVDVNEVATEIAKLRIWLKIIEGNGWDEEFGRLPNIDVNILPGNSLVGFPIVGEHYPTEVWDEDIEELVELREEYKYGSDGGGTSMKEIDELLDEEIRPRVNQKFIENLNYTVETEIGGRDEFDAVVETFPNESFYPTVEKVQVQRADGESLTEEDKDELEEMGFTTYGKSANLDVEDRQKELRERTRESYENEWDLMLEELRGLLDDGYVFSEFVRQPLPYDLENIEGVPFHWVVEFAEVAEVDGGSHSVNFDIIVGNPPYGDILGDAGKVFTENYKTGGINEVSAQFVERQLQLLEEGGYFGNVTTLRLVYQSSLEEFHEILRNNLSPAYVACFGFRPSRIFENAHVRVAIITGEKGDADNDIHTSDLVLFNEENRQQRLENIVYGSARGLYLRDRIDGDGNTGPVLPKVGDSTKRNILTSIKDASDTVFRDRYLREEPDGNSYIIYKRRGVLYWINPMLEELYSSTLVDPLWYERELDRDVSFLILNSSLYILYWYTYGNQHTHEWLQMSAFPYPEEERIEKYSEEIHELKNILWKRMKGTFSKSRDNRGDFFMGELRPIIDDVDELMGKLYNLSDEETDYAKNYLTELGENSGRAGKGDESLTYEPIFND